MSSVAMSVSMSPGDTELTRMPSPATSVDSPRENATTAPLVAA